MDREKIISLLGSGIAANVVASHLGVSPALISQVASEPEAATAIAQLRFDALQKHNKLDDAVSELEEKVLEKMGKSLFMISRPMELVAMYKVLNAAQRRGASAPQGTVINSNVVTLVLPQVVNQKFVANSVNQVVQAGSQQLTTIGARNLEGLLAERVIENEHESTAPVAIPA